MKAHGILSDIVGLVMVFLIVVAGIAISTSLLDRQEDALIGKKELIQVGTGITMPFQTKHTDVAHPHNPVLAEEHDPRLLYARLYVWEHGSETPREPRAGEYTMEQALESVRAEIGSLIDLGVVPQIDLTEYVFRDAKLTASSVPTINTQELTEVDGIQIPSSQGRWKITLNHTSDPDDLLTVVCDARTGAIYSVMASDHSVGCDEREQLFMFAKYHGLLRGDDAVSITAGDGSVTLGSFILKSTTNLHGNELSIEIQN